MWLSLKSVPDYLIPQFKSKIIDELNNGKTNVFELAHIIKELRSYSQINSEEFMKILLSHKIQSNPSVVIKILSDKEINQFDDINGYFNNIQIKKVGKEIWTAELLNKIYN